MEWLLIGILILPLVVVVFMPLSWAAALDGYRKGQRRRRLPRAKTRAYALADDFENVTLFEIVTAAEFDAQPTWDCGRERCAPHPWSREICYEHYSCNVRHPNRDHHDGVWTLPPCKPAKGRQPVKPEGPADVSFKPPPDPGKSRRMPPPPTATGYDGYYP